MVAFESELTTAFLAHWTSLRRGTAIPTTEDYLDRMDRRFAPLIVVFDCTAEDVIVRLQGTAVVERWGVNRTGQSWLAHKPPGTRAAILANMTDCVARPCGVWAYGAAVSRLGRSAKLENLTLPLGVRGERPLRLVTLSNQLDRFNERDGAKDHSAKRTLDWYDVGFGVPPHGLRAHA